MRISQRSNNSFTNNINSKVPLSKKQPIKKPREYVTTLHNNIQEMQQAIKTYNQSDKNSIGWKKKLNLPMNSCQLKTLTQPKYQHILLQSNFFSNNIVENSIMGRQQHLYANNNNNKNSNSFLRSSLRKSNNQQHQHSIYNYSNKQYNPELLKISKTSSIHNNNNNKQQQQKNQQPSRQSPSLNSNNIRFNSFHEQVSRFDKMVYMDDNIKLNKNYSLANNRHQLQLNRKNNKVNNKNKQSLIITDERDSLQQYKSIIHSSTMSFYNNHNNPQQQSHNNNNNTQQQINQLLFLPISQEKHIPSIIIQNNNKRCQTAHIKKQLQLKTQRLQRQWVKTQSYKEKYHILCQKQEKQHQNTQRKNNINNHLQTSRLTKRSKSKLATIMQRIQHNHINSRPSTSTSYQGQKIYSTIQQSHHTTTVRQKLNTTTNNQQQQTNQ